MDVEIEESWKRILRAEFETEYFKQLVKFVREEYQSHKIYPPAKQIFSAFEHTSIDNLKVVIIGQDPYHGEGQANGLCFSVSPGIKPPPSLMNIYKERSNDLGKDIPTTGNLENWAKQGVLLLNATLTVRANSPGSHQNKGWEEFTDAVIKKTLESKTGLVFMLWGAYAQKKGSFIDRNHHMVIESTHPSPFSAHKGFLGSKPFSRCNQYLKSIGKEEINW